MKKLIFTIILLQVSVATFSQLVIQMNREGGVSIVPCKVNGLSLSFIFDTGASDVTISLTEASFMLKNGYLKKEDIIGSENYLDATGNISEGITINIREIEIEGLKLYNVKASIVKTLGAPLLLGQSALSKLGIIYLDLNKNQLTITNASELTNTVIKKSNDAQLNTNAYKKVLIYLRQLITSTSNDNIAIAKYFTLNTDELINKDSLWYIPLETYKDLNASSYYYTHINTNKIKLANQGITEISLSQVLNNLKSYSQAIGLDWTLLDTTNILVKPFSDDDITVSFTCGNKQYCFVTRIIETFTDSIKLVKINLPYRIDSKSFFEFRNAVYKKFLFAVEDYIIFSKDQNLGLSYFYDDLLSLESSYNSLSTSDKQVFSSIDFEPSFWCKRAANLRMNWVDDEKILLKRLSLLTKGISLYENNLYPFTKKSFEFLFLYSYRGECKYKLEDYDGAYKDYKKVIDFYEQNISSKVALKYSITEFYYDFANICYILKRYNECNLSIQKGISTYSTDLDKYLVNVTLYRLYSLKGRLNYFIYKNKKKACEGWSRAGELGDKEAFDFIKQYCNK